MGSCCRILNTPTTPAAAATVTRSQVIAYEVSLGGSSPLAISYITSLLTLAALLVLTYRFATDLVFKMCVCDTLCMRYCYSLCICYCYTLCMCYCYTLCMCYCYTLTRCSMCACVVHEIRDAGSDFGVWGLGFGVLSDARAGTNTWRTMRGF